MRSLDGELNADPTPAAVAFEVNTALFDLELVEAAFGPLYASLHEFYAGDAGFAQGPPGRVTVRSRYDRPLRVKISAFIPGLMDFPTDTVVTAPPGELLRVPLRVELSDRSLDLEKTESRQLRLVLQYSIGGDPKEYESTLAVTVVEKHGMTWEEPERIGLYVTHLDGAVERFARETVRAFREIERSAIVYDNLLRAIELFDALGAHGVRYLPDPANPSAGSCPGARPRHRAAAARDPAGARRGLRRPRGALRGAARERRDRHRARGRPRPRLRDVRHGAHGAQRRAARARPGAAARGPRGRVWVPVETTLVGQPFSAAWEAAAATLASRRFTVIGHEGGLEEVRPAAAAASRRRRSSRRRSRAVRALVAEDLRRQEEALTSPRMRELAQRVAADPADADAVNALGVLLARRGYLGRAAAHFERVIELRPDFAGGYGNLGNVLYEQGRYPEAVKRYDEALARTELPEVHVELALTWCELGRFERAREHYRRAMELGGAAEE